MKMYEEAEVEIILFSEKDIITASGGDDGGQDSLSNEFGL